MTRRRQILLDCCILFLFGAALVWPYFTKKYTDKWPSIESTFISDARFLAAHWPHPRWQPLWYTGTRFDYVYPPALRYGTAIISKITGLWPVEAYHFYTMFFYSVGIAGVYLLMRVGGRSRAAAYAGGAAAGLMSPSFLFLKNMRLDAGWWEPVRFGALVKYGEGPHITSLALIPIALAFTWLAMERRRPAWMALAAIFCAAVALNNFYGATALAMLYPILAWSFWITRRDSRILLIAVAIPALAYGLTAFWLVPSYFRITIHNMQYVSERGNTWSVGVAAAVTAVFLLISWKLARSRPERTWAVFSAGALLFFAVNVLGHQFIRFRIMGEPGRLVPELDLVIIMGVLTMLEWLWRRRGIALKVVVVLIVAVAFATTYRFVKHAWSFMPRWPDYQARVEYRITGWLWKNMPDARALPAGTVRFWFDAWHDLAQMGGGSEQGLLNPLVEFAQWEIAAGTDPQFAILWMQALGVDVIYTAGEKSEEPYKDFRNLDRFAGPATPLLYDDGRGNALHRIPRRWAPRVRVVETALLDAQQTPRNNQDMERLRPYVDAIEHGPDAPASLERPDTDQILVHAKRNAGQSVVVQETWDPAWQAWSGSTRLGLRKDAMGFLLVDAPPGDDEIRLVFAMPLENRVGWMLTALSLAALLWLFLRREQRR
ncbi:MAG: hypothetical protein ABSH40_09480 [Bryobacteraceae bacterium]|jgi:hypothetical protein